jgi:hypothetical protein
MSDYETIAIWKRGLCDGELFFFGDLCFESTIVFFNLVNNLHVECKADAYAEILGHQAELQTCVRTLRKLLGPYLRSCRKR